MRAFQINKLEVQTNEKDVYTDELDFQINGTS